MQLRFTIARPRNTYTRAILQSTAMRLYCVYIIIGRYNNNTTAHATNVCNNKRESSQMDITRKSLAHGETVAEQYHFRNNCVTTCVAQINVYINAMYVSEDNGNNNYSTHAADG